MKSDYQRMSAMDEAEEYQSAVRELEESYKSGIKAFATWFAREWQITPEEWVKSYDEPLPSPEWFTGWNAGVESAVDALHSFLGDYHP